MKENKFGLNIGKGGRPPRYETPQELEEECFKYLEHCIKKDEKPTITGMTLFVGFSSRSSWDDYKKREGFEYIVKRAKLTIENSYEVSGTTFDMFALKNMGWKDKTEVSNTNINTTYTPTKEDILKAQESLKNLDI